MLSFLMFNALYNPNRGIQIYHQEHQKSGADFSISSKKRQFLKHQRRGLQQIPKIGEKPERERNFNIASKTACRAFEPFCPCHRLKVRRCRKTGRLRAFLVSEKRRSTVLKLVIINRSKALNPSFSDGHSIKRASIFH